MPPLRGIALILAISSNLIGQTDSEQQQAKTQCRVEKFTTDCSHMKLYKVPADIPKSTKKLILSHNTIPVLTTQSFYSLADLEDLDLSYNSVSHVDEQTFQNNRKLKSLLLEHNEVAESSLPYGVFLPVRNLTELNLGHNRLVSMTDDMFANTPRLRYLNLAENGLQLLKMGKDADLANLKELIVSKNRLSGLSPTNFAGLKGASLSVMDLSDNQISSVENGTFLSVKSIKTLNVSGSFRGDVPQTVRKLAYQLKGKSLEKLVMKNLNIQKVDAGMFAGFAAEGLEHLDLSCNNITVLTESSSFIGLEELRYLDLDINNLYNFNSSALIELKSLHSLSMNDNLLPILRGGLFSSIASLPLKYLYIRNNKITTIEPGAFLGLGNLVELGLYTNQINQQLSQDHFAGLDKIERLDLGHNKISLSAKTFDNLKNLTHLYLNLNHMTSVSARPSPFRHLTALKTLDLSNNNMDSLAADTFQYLVSMETLYLQHNNLAGLWKKSRPGGPVLMLRNLTRLENLHLGWNGFDDVPGGALRNLSRLTRVNLERNKINFLPDSLFADAGNLQQLELQNNLITLVNRSNLAPFLRALRVLNVANNTLSCSCDLEWFRKWVGTTGAEVVEVEKYKCMSPPSMYKQPFLSYHPPPWECDHIPPMWAWQIGIPSLVALVMLTAFAVRYRGYIQCLHYLIKARCNNYSVLTDSVSDYSYDAYIACSAADEDKNWVTEYLIPNVEECAPPKYKLYFSDRDQTAGMIIENAANLIERSRKTICIVTPSFLQNEWCNYQKDMALQQYFDDHKDILVLIFLQPVPQRSLTQYERVHKFLNKKSYLEWPHDRGKQLAFWQRLKSVLGAQVDERRNVGV